MRLPADRRTIQIIGVTFLLCACLASPAGATSILYNSGPPANCGGIPLTCHPVGIAQAVGGGLFPFTLAANSQIERLDFWGAPFTATTLDIWSSAFVPLPFPAFGYFDPVNKIGTLAVAATSTTPFAPDETGFIWSFNSIQLSSPFFVLDAGVYFVAIPNSLLLGSSGFGYTFDPTGVNKTDLQGAYRIFGTSPVPEPSAFLLVGSGLVFAMTYRFRRRRPRRQPAGVSDSDTPHRRSTDKPASTFFR